MKNPLISVIVPCYNVEKYLKISLQSIYSQSFKDLEIILIDDGSTDSTKLVIKRATERDSRVRSYFQVNKGVSAARNLGLEHAKGKYIYFIDADDKIDSKLFTSIHTSIQQNHPDLIIFGYRKINENNETLRTRVPSQRRLYKNKTEIGQLFCSLTDHELFNSPWNKIYKLELIRQNHLTFPEISIGEDAVFNYQYYRIAHKIQTLDVSLYCYVVLRDGSATVSQNYFDIKLLQLLNKEKKLTMATLNLDTKVVFETSLISTCYEVLKRQIIYDDQSFTMNSKFHQIRKQITVKYGIIGTILRCSNKNKLKLFLLYHIRLLTVIIFLQSGYNKCKERFYNSMR